MNIEKKMREILEKRGSGYMVLIDPDKQKPEEAAEIAVAAERAGADIILVGSSITLDDTLNRTVQEVKKKSSLPVVIFPGSSTHVSPFADAVFFMSLVSGRNPTYLIEEQVKAAPMVKKYSMEPIPVAYLLIDGGKTTSVEFMSNTKPIPADKPDLAVAHVLAAQYMGMRWAYLEAGSGALTHVPAEVVTAVKKFVEIPLIVGGGILEPETAKELVKAGADFIVTGTVLEKEGGNKLAAFAKAIHRK